MVKQRGLGQSNRKELTHNGTNIKKKSGHQERSASLLKSVTWLTASWPGGYSGGSASAAVSTDRLRGDLVERNRHVVMNRPLRRPHPSASFWGPASSFGKMLTMLIRHWVI